ncbi:hypothetical protein CLV99_1683 [Sphingobacterium yanglingense]|uniref:Uncharacterized protein n=1 Tax=Sphingobacterium yanglingense TaxID=1437280 RepID=A0A4R6WTU6_9SPHI|nr:hypothetical protein CLV99_1683 [Sphingobacterium yanglingense]
MFLLVEFVQGHSLKEDAIVLPELRYLNPVVAMTSFLILVDLFYLDFNG